MPPKNKSKKKEVTVTYIPPPSVKTNDHEVIAYDPETKFVDDFEKDIEFLLRDGSTPVSNPQSMLAQGQTKPSPKDTHINASPEQFHPGEIAVKKGLKLTNQLKQEILDFDIDFGSSDDDESDIKSSSIPHPHLTLPEQNHDTNGIRKSQDLDEDKRILFMLEEEMLKELNVKPAAIKNLDKYESDSITDGYDYLNSDSDEDYPNFDEDHDDFDYGDLEIEDHEEEPFYSEGNHISGYRSPSAEGTQMTIQELRQHIIEMSNDQKLNAPQKRRRIKRLKNLYRILADKEGKDGDYYFDHQGNITNNEFMKLNKDVTTPVQQHQQELTENGKFNRVIANMKIIEIDRRLSQINKSLKYNSISSEQKQLLTEEKRALCERKLHLEEQSRAAKSKSSTRSSTASSTMKIIDIDKRLSKINSLLKNISNSHKGREKLQDERANLRTRKQAMELEIISGKSKSTAQARTLSFSSSPDISSLTVIEIDQELRQVNKLLKGLTETSKDYHSLKEQKAILCIRKLKLEQKKISVESKVLKDTNPQDGQTLGEIEARLREINLELKSPDIKPTRIRNLKTKREKYKAKREPLVGTRSKSKFPKQDDSTSELDSIYSDSSIASPMTFVEAPKAEESEESPSDQPVLKPRTRKSRSARVREKKQRAKEGEIGAE